MSKTHEKSDTQKSAAPFRNFEAESIGFTIQEAAKALAPIGLQVKGIEKGTAEMASNGSTIVNVTLTISTWVKPKES